MSVTPFILAQTLGVLHADFDGYLGYLFNTGINTPTINQLGRWKVAGNDQTHNLYLYQFVDGAGGDIQLGTCSVDMTSGVDAAYLYADLSSPVTLAPGTDYYVISQEVGFADQWYDDDTVATSTTPSFGTLSASVFSFSLGSMAGNKSAPNFYVPVNMTTVTASQTTVLIEGSHDAQHWEDFSNGGVTNSVAKDLIPGIRFWRTNIVENSGTVTSSVGAVPLKPGGTKGVQGMIRTKG